MTAILLNLTVMPWGALYPGQPIAADQLADVVASGGSYLDDSDANIALASRTCEDLRLAGRSTTDVLASIMNIAVNKTQTTTIAAGVTGPTGPTGATSSVTGPTGSTGPTGPTVTAATAASYTAGTSSSWVTSPPTTIASALDRLAALAKTLNSGTAVP